LRTYLAGFVLSFIVALVVTPAVRRLSLALGIVDAPDPERKVHDRPIPRTGGVALLASVLLPLASFAFFMDRVAIGAVFAAPGNFRGIFVGAVLVCALGVVDDLRGMSAWPKLVGQVAIAAVMFVFEFRVDTIGNPFGGGPVALGWLSLPATLLWYVAVMNAMNLIDGLDGLATGLGLVTTLVLFAVAVVTGNAVLGTVTAVLAGALAGFLVFNFNPARIFLGDSGSLLLGFLLATISIMTQSKGQTALAMFMPVVALGVPFLDMALSMLRRFASRRPLFQGDRKHIHHLLLERGFTPRKVALLLYGIAGLFGAVALASMIRQDAMAMAAIVAALFVVVFVLTRFLGYHQMVWLSRADLNRLESPGAMRFRSLLLDLAALPAGRAWDDFAAVLRRHGVLGAHVFRRDGVRRVPILTLDAFPRGGPDVPRLSVTFRVELPDGSEAEMLFQWTGETGKFVPQPHEEALLRVVADLVRTLRWPDPEAGGAEGGGS
jgi:UDP-GlcNAc:undecaprenyl-phosphate GlcNAc-1-phosphate transferase